MLPQKQNNTLINFCQSKEELQVCDSFLSVNLAESQADYTNRIIDIVAKWRWMSGINTNNQDEDSLAQELVLIAKFIIENYENIKYSEIELAINLSLTNKLDVDVRTFNSFSPMYVSRILNAYMEYSRRIIQDLKERRYRDEDRKMLEKEPTSEEKMESMKDLIAYLYEEYKSCGEIKDHFATLYNYLKRTNKIKIPKDLIEEAMNYGKQKAKSFEPTTYERIFNKNEKDNLILEKRFARNYCVQKLFDEIGLDGMIAKVELKDF